jgi:hypothetical protein
MARMPGVASCLPKATRRFELATFAHPLPELLSKNEKTPQKTEILCGVAFSVIRRRDQPLVLVLIKGE